MEKGGRERLSEGELLAMISVYHHHLFFVARKLSGQSRFYRTSRLHACLSRLQILRLVSFHCLCDVFWFVHAGKRAGILYKKGKGRNEWKPRWFVLNSNEGTISYFKSKSSVCLFPVTVSFVRVSLIVLF